MTNHAVIVAELRDTRRVDTPLWRVAGDMRQTAPSAVSVVSQSGVTAESPIGRASSGSITGTPSRIG
jgi:hypothetical protein